MSEPTCLTCEDVGLVKLVTVGNRDTGRFQRCACTDGKPLAGRKLNLRSRRDTVAPPLPTPPPIPKVGSYRFKLDNSERVLAEACAKHYGMSVSELAHKTLMNAVKRS